MSRNNERKKDSKTETLLAVGKNTPILCRTLIV